MYAGHGRRLARDALLAFAALLAGAAPARATPFQATLSFVVDSAIGTLGAVSFVGSSSGTSTPGSVTVPGGLFAGSSSHPVAGVPSLSALSIRVSGNGAGRFSGPYPFLDGHMPVSGAIRVKGSLGAGPLTLASIPLQVTAHALGSEARGIGTRTAIAGTGFVAYFYSWATRAEPVPASWGRYIYSYHIAGGKAASRRTTYPYTAAKGSDVRTPGGLGQVTLVSPIRIETDLPGAGSLLIVFGTLTLSFVPEPGTLVLLGAGVGALAVLGRRRPSGRS